MKGVLKMTSAHSPVSDRRAAAEFLAFVLDGDVDAGMAVLTRAESVPGGRDELVNGLAMTCLDALMLAHGGPIGAREQLELALLDVSLEDDGGRT
jgi:hypothetical protein